MLTRRLFTAMAIPTMAQNILRIPPAEPGKRLAYGSDPSQFGELRLPEGKAPHPVVLFIHGGYWRATYDLSHARHLCAAIAKAGYAVWSVEYRRTGQPGGGYPGTFDDVRAAFAWLPSIPALDLTRVVVAGHSAGGQLALWLAAQEGIALKGVAGLAAISDLRRGHALNLGRGAIDAFMGCGPADCGDHYSKASPMDLLPLKVPQVLIHGTADDTVPFELSKRFARASANARLVPLEGSGHFEPIDPRAKEWPRVLEEIVRPIARTNAG